MRPEKPAPCGPAAHWGIEDPAAVDGPEQRDAFLKALRYLRNRIALFLELPTESVDRMSLQQRLREIGARRDAEPELG